MNKGICILKFVSLFISMFCLAYGDKYFGVDVSEYLLVGGDDYRYDSTTTNALVILRWAGYNTVRIRVWTGKPFDMEYGKRLAKECKRYGFRIFLDLHLSDSWADPGKQVPPKSWGFPSLPSFASNLSNYISQVIQEFQRDGIDIDLIQVGNEVDNGFLWPIGHITNRQNFLYLQKLSVNLIKSLSPSTKVVLHLTLGNINNIMDIINLLKDVAYDYVGFSYYPWWHGSLYYLKFVLKRVYETFGKDILIVETAYPWGYSWCDTQRNIVGEGSPILKQFPATPEGQHKYIETLMELVEGESFLRGFIYWGGLWVCNTNYPSPWENLALFDHERRALYVLQKSPLLKSF